MRAVSRWLYLPGLGTGVRSVKGAAVGQLLSSWGHTLETVDLRVPDFRTMGPTAMVAAARAAIGGPADRAILFGTSLGGYVAAQVAAEDPRVAAVVLYAPALELGRLRAQRPFGTWLWEQVGWVPMRDKTEARLRPLGVDFLHDVDRIGATPPDIKAPLLLVHGTHDETVDVGVSRRYAAAHPEVRFLELADGHNLFASMPTVLAETEAFLGPWLHERGARAG